MDTSSIATVDIVVKFIWAQSPLTNGRCAIMQGSEHAYYDVLCPHQRRMTQEE